MVTELLAKIGMLFAVVRGSYVQFKMHDSTEQPNGYSDGLMTYV